MQAVDDVAIVGGAAVALFALAGFGLTRLLLPGELRAHELVWILPVGACALACELAALGYARVPFEVSLPLACAGNAALAAYAVRTRGLPERPRLEEVAWPLWIALLAACLALVPLFRAGELVVIGTGSDAHLAAGTANLLLEHAPTEIAAEEPVDRVPVQWRSKPPIYYPLAGVAQVSGVETWEALAVVAAVVFGLAVLGFFLLARDALGAGLAGAVAAMIAVALDRVALQTITHPYYNQSWGFFTLPFAIVLAWWAARTRTRGAYALLGLFLAVGAFAYPLMLPIPLIALGVVLRPERRRLKSVWRGKRSLLWMVPLALVAAVPVRGVIEKAASAMQVVVDPTVSLRAWGGDLVGFIPEHQFVGMPSARALIVIAIPALIAIAFELRRQPRSLALSLGGVLVFGVLAAAWFRPRDFGWYFHFKALAFVGPLAVLIAVVGVSRLRKRWAMVLALAFAINLGIQGARDELLVTFDQTPRWMTSVRDADALLPPGQSVRLDVHPPRQLWPAYFLAGQPLCSGRPLIGTSYPRVPTSQRADYALRERSFGPPRDAAGGPVWQNEHFTLHRLDGTAPGPENCSQLMVQEFDDIAITGRARR